MFQFLLLFSVIAVLSIFASLGIFYFGHRRVIKDFRSAIDEINDKFYDKLSAIDLSELGQTASGKELLVLLVNSEKKGFHGSYKLWPNQSYRQEMIELARHREMSEAALLYDQRVRERFEEITNNPERVTELIARMKAVEDPAKLTEKEYRKRPMAK